MYKKLSIPFTLWYLHHLLSLDPVTHTWGQVVEEYHECERFYTIFVLDECLVAWHFQWVFNCVWKSLNLAHVRCNKLSFCWDVSGWSIVHSPSIFLCITPPSLDIAFDSRHEFSSLETDGSCLRNLLKVSDSQTVLEWPYKHLLVWVYGFDGGLVKTDKIFP